MKVGTDGVLLGAWAETKGKRRILEIGAGSGLISLMLAQRTAENLATVDAVEIDSAAFEQARENVAASPWQERIKLHCDSIQNFVTEQFDLMSDAEAGERFDLIVCNPPYFSGDSVPPDARRNLARHSASLTGSEFWKLAEQLCQPSGNVAVIVPEQSAEPHLQLARENGFDPVRQTRVHPLPGRPPVRRLIECQRREFALITCDHSELTLERERHQRTPAFSELIRDFYLNP